MIAGYVDQVAFAASHSPIRWTKKGDMLMLSSALFPECPNQSSSPLWAFRFLTHQMVILHTVIYFLTISIKGKKKKCFLCSTKGQGEITVAQMSSEWPLGRHNSCIKNMCPHTSPHASYDFWIHLGFELHWAVSLGVIHGSLIVYTEENYTDDTFNRFQIRSEP